MVSIACPDTRPAADGNRARKQGWSDVSRKGRHLHDVPWEIQKSICAKTSRPLLPARVPIPPVAFRILATTH